MMRPPFKLYFPSGPTKAQRAADDAEAIAAALAGVKADLERRHVTDPKVWSGCPWPEGVEDEDMPYVHVGLFEHLVRCTRGDPSERMATAIDIAFELGRTSIVGKVDPAVAKRLLAGMSARVDGAAIGHAESLKKRQAKADDRDRAAFYDRWWEKRGTHLVAGRRYRRRPAGEGRRARHEREDGTGGHHSMGSGADGGTNRARQPAPFLRTF